MMTTPADGEAVEDLEEDPTLARGYAAIAANPTDVADYVAEYTQSLARLARASKLELLAYLLDVAHLEARTVLGTPSGQRREG